MKTIQLRLAEQRFAKVVKSFKTILRKLVGFDAHPKQLVGAHS